MKIQRLNLAIAVSALVISLTSGCALALLGGAAAAGAGAMSYVKGELIKTEPESLDQTWGAVQDAAIRLNLAVTERQKDPLTAHLEARSTGDKKITINLKNKGERLTELGIRVDTFGDQALSRSILDEIEKGLPRS